MKVIINYDGKEYVSESTSEYTAEQAIEVFYERLEITNKFKVKLESGGILLLPSDAVKGCTMLFIDD